MSLEEELRNVVSGEVDTSKEALEKCSRDASLFRMMPEAIVHPRDAEDIGALVRFVTDKNTSSGTRLSLTARSAGTDMSGGPLTDSIVVDMLAHFNKLIKLEGDEAVVEPGMYFRDFDTETQKKNLELPSYTASREIATVGGMAANNSGGEKNLKYGKTARWVEELEVVLSDGKAHSLRNLDGEALKHKLAEQGFEGDLYRRVAALLSSPTHASIIEAHKPQVEKNSAGYALWDIGDGTHSLNLARLMVGAQGTLGIITQIRFKLVHPKPYSSMVILFVKQLSQLGELVPEVLKYAPDSFESYDDHTFKIALKYLSELAVQMKSGLINLGISFIPELWLALTSGIPKLVLLVEFRGDTQAEALGKAQKLASEIASHPAHAGVRIAKNEAASRKYWAVRRESFNLLRKKVKNRRTAPYFDDFVVPPSSLPEFLPKLEAILSQYPRLIYTIAGHVGDGNLHIIPLIDPRDPTIAKTLEEICHKVYDLVLSYHGSITGEHNDGLVRTPYIEKMFGSEMVALFRDVKKIFDPNGIFNPGKKVGTTFEGALAKLDLPHSKDQ